MTNASHKLPGSHGDIVRSKAPGVVGKSFWEVVREPFLRRELPRQAIVELVRRAHAEAGGSYRAMSRLLGIEGEYRKLINFLHHHDLGATRRS